MGRLNWFNGPQWSRYTNYKMVEKARIDTRSVGRELYGGGGPVEHPGMEADPDWEDAQGGHMH